jgi:transporter family protein
MQSISPWLLWALLSAMFAALTAIFAKVGVQNINSDFATLIRTLVIVAIIVGICVARGAYQPINTISAKTYIFLILSGLATGASWICYFRALQLGDASRVAPMDKLSVVLVAILGVAVFGEHLRSYNWLGIALAATGLFLIAVP